MSEQDYVNGSQRAWITILSLAVRELGPEKGDTERWRIERAETVAILRQVCKHHGDNEWPDDLHLTDVIEKHLWRHLEES